MGSCFSTATTNVGAVNPPQTAKVITLGGALREYCARVAASDALLGEGAACFLCSSDKLYCDDYIPAMEPEEPLQPGQIYFVLPEAKLRYPLSGEEMAALAVKASSAMALAAEKGGRRKKIRIMPVQEVDGECAGGGVLGDEVKSFEGKIGPAPPSLAVQRKMRRNASAGARAACGYRRSSRARLSTIPELVE